MAAKPKPDWPGADNIIAGDLVPAQRGPRNNLVLIMCAVPIIIMSVLVFLILKA